MLAFFPKLITNKAIVTYIASLGLVSIAFMSYTMNFIFIIIGTVFVILFFCILQYLSKTWKSVSDVSFEKNVFGLAVLLRVVWICFSYYFYTAKTGLPFEWEAADSWGYHSMAVWLSTMSWRDAFGILLIPDGGISDVGYVVYLTLLYKIMGPNIFVTRLIKALLSAWSCVLFYKLASRTFGENTGRITGLFCALMPNLIVYCGLHLKETEMLFCCAMFLERADYLFRTKKHSIITVVIPTLFAFSLFFFRTVLGVVAVFSFFTALMFNSEEVIKKGKKVLLVIWMLSAIFVTAGGAVLNEVENYYELRVSNETLKREHQSKTAKWAKYATGTVMAPMIFVLPFSTMIDTQQYNQNMLYGGAFVKNFLGVFVIFALFYAIKKKKWRDFSLIGSFAIAYLGIISFSGYANAERFHFPTLPCVLMMAAYGVSQLNTKNLKFINYWCFVVVLMEFSWAFFKLGSRGLASF